MNILESMRKINKRSTFTIQITSMCDMMTILLAFLLHQQASSSAQISPVEGLELPRAYSAGNPVEALKLVVTQKGIFVNEKKVAEISDGKIPTQFIDKNDNWLIPSLFEELDQQAENSKKIAKVNETVEFDGKLVLMADMRLNYKLIKQIMYTASLAGYSNVKLASVNMGE